ncbi:polysaccharide pyruvyl transferase family protein [Pantoea anthophila]|uniref:polysaccharide pyruvyl transferase family protein n=1 Tax=Pantoea anthophila TaxID=470931 RepID=UPI002DBD8474|nr:polysaccharide pyruvyl transferase family protein [Pantoea anthophila]MEB6222349.1 polysaccharide pyruvyl transferase family protein [Pantoea anthophila]
MNFIIDYLKNKVVSSTCDSFSAPHKEKCFYLISACGMPNFGDDMLTRGWINTIKRSHPDAIIYIDAVDPVVAASLFDGVICVNYLWQLAQALGHEGSIEEKLADRYMLPTRERLMLALFSHVDSMHLLGGGYINDLSGGNWRLIELIAYFSKENAFPCYATGLGLQPLSTESAARIAPFISQYTLFDVRDFASFNALDSIMPGQVSFIGDDYFCFPFSETASINENEIPSLRLCINDELSVDNSSNQILLNIIEDSITTFSELYPSSPIFFYEFRPGFDGVFWKEISKKYSNIQMIFFEQAWSDGLSVSKNDFFITTRFHFQLIISSLGLRGVSLYWNDYYKNKFDSLKPVSHWTTIDLHHESFDSHTFFQNHDLAFTPDFNEVLNKKQLLSSRIYGTTIY